MSRVLLAAALLAACPVQAAPQVVKLATLVPDGSVWDRVLRGMGEEWQQATAGRVSLRVYPGGVAGDEPDVVRKMRIGQLHAAALTVTGLIDIDPAFRVFGIPLFFQSYDELFYVLDELEPLLETRLRDKGFVFLNWGQAGWVHVFSKRPVREPRDLEALKIFVWAGSEETVRWWKDNGFQPVALAATDIMTGLQTGMIDALPTTPLVALSLQWFRQVGYMLDLGMGPLVGATVVTEKAWERLEPGDRTALSEAARRAQDRLEREIPGQDRQAVEEMAKRGLQVTEAADEERWRAIAEQFVGVTTAGQIPEEVLQQALAARARYRSRQEAKESH